MMPRDTPRIATSGQLTIGLVERQLFRTRLLRQLMEFDRNLRDVLLVRVANDRHEQTELGVHGDADVDVLLVDDRPAVGVQ